MDLAKLRSICLSFAVTVAMAVGGALADNGEQGDAGGLLERETLTNNWLGLGETLEDQGVTVSLGLTQVYQLNLTEGVATHRRAGRYTGSYDLELSFDLEKLLNLAGAEVCVAGEGSWSDGLDASSIGSVGGFEVNGDAGGDRAIDVAELFYQQSLLDGRLQFRIGKLDVSGGFECRGCPVAFDGNSYANDEVGQFLNAALVNNPTIPFPDNGLGGVVYVQPLDWMYLAVGGADAQADARETGLRTAFHDADYFFGIFETGVTPQLPSANGPLTGAYRAGLWYDPQPKAEHNGRTKRDDVGFYLSFDQLVVKENADAEDSQGLGLFARYGYAHDDANEVDCFWSVGGQYQGLLPGRDEDVLGLGVAQGQLVSPAGFSDEQTTVMEAYYGIKVTGWLSVSPSVQYLANPGGAGADDAVVLGVRAQLSF